LMSLPLNFDAHRPRIRHHSDSPPNVIGTEYRC
jgi:hypothetical protein